MAERPAGGKKKKKKSNKRQKLYWRVKSYEKLLFRT